MNEHYGDENWWVLYAEGREEIGWVGFEIQEEAEQFMASQVARQCATGDEVIMIKGSIYKFERFK